LVYVGLYKKSPAVKIGVERVQELLATEAGHKFDPSGMGRPMKEWVVVREKVEASD